MVRDFVSHLFNKSKSAKSTPEEEGNAGNQKHVHESAHNLMGYHINHRRSQDYHYIKPTTIMSPLSTKKHFSQLPQDDLYFHLSDAIAFLKQQGYFIDGTNVSYYSSMLGAYVNCNSDPVP